MFYNSGLLQKNSAYILLPLGNINEKKKHASVVKLESIIYIDGFSITKLNSRYDEKWFMIHNTVYNNDKILEYARKYMTNLKLDYLYVKLFNEESLKLYYSDMKNIPVNLTNYNTTDLNDKSINIYNENYNFTISIDKMYKIVENLSDINNNTNIEYLTSDGKWANYNAIDLDDEKYILNKLIKYKKLRLII